ncbi:nitronate monooxygenase [Haloarcula sp. CBA1130]|uniref:NAD(P)H-dependent flavin oxidoreductase n=1 Tax=unclassified Haloarcula TaxID=2624677 RepID=UPI001246C921|nr:MULTISPECIES: nitronate monooxygenase [unclassified Haloarcula]KAA9398652.1 nitronate monooxygenase [Haloarcula sp. CBA1129]KAA9403169.1 nitronate monooxygenase [Haloarcula sp. CBA1130]
MAPLHTALCAELNVDHPVVQAPVGSVSTPALAAAVADAGGVGMLAMSWREADAIREAYTAAATATDGVVGVNVVLDESTGVLSPSACLDACLDAGASVVSFSFGDAEPYIDRVHDAGGTAMVTVGSAAEAAAAADAGADVVVAQGREAGGHVQSDVTTMALLPRVADTVEVPVVAAGGLGDGRGLAAALTLGADGGWFGTRFVATEESGAHETYRERIVDAPETATRLTDLFDRGWPDQPHRVLETDEVRRQAGYDPDEMDDASDPEQIAQMPDGKSISRLADMPPLEGMTGAVEALPHYAGQSAGLTAAVRPAGEVVTRLVSDAAGTLADASAAAE